MKLFFSAFFMLIAASVYGQQAEKANDLVDYINPLMGTDSKPDLSNGNTLTRYRLPWGMNT